MANTFIEKEIHHIFQDQEKDKSHNGALAIAWLCAHFKTLNTKIYHVSENSSLADYYIISSAQNSTQSKSLVDELIPVLKKHGFPPLSVEGLQEAKWVLLDLGNIIVHIFQEDTRDIYGLDQLWQSYPQIPIPQSFFTGSGRDAEKLFQEEDKDNNIKDYF